MSVAERRRRQGQPAEEQRQPGRAPRGGASIRGGKVTTPADNADKARMIPVAALVGAQSAGQLLGQDGKWNVLPGIALAAVRR